MSSSSAAMYVGMVGTYVLPTTSPSGVVISSVTLTESSPVSFGSSSTLVTMMVTVIMSLSSPVGE